MRDDEARARLAQYGPNELAVGKPRSAWRRFLAQCKDALVILLLVATAISTGVWIYERNASLPYEALDMFVVVLLNAAMGYVQETRAESAVAALRAMSADDAMVLRDGEPSRVLTSTIVPGDLILIEEGDTIPADAASWIRRPSRPPKPR